MNRLAEWAHSQLVERDDDALQWGLSPRTLFLDMTLIPDERKAPIELYCIWKGCFARIDPAPPAAGLGEQLLWHTLLVSGGAAWGALRKSCAALFRDDAGSEAGFQARYARELSRRGVAFAEQVACAAGVADIVCSEFVYELKMADDLFHACGQAVMYAACLGRKPKIVVPWPPKPGHAEAVALAGVELEVWR